MKGVLIGGLGLLVALAGLWWFGPARQSGAEVIATRGLHWHAALSLYVRGERQDISGDIGVGTRFAGLPTYDSGMRMTAVHTHEPDGTIHLEFPGRVLKEDTTLGTFFRVWGKDFMAFGTSVRMLVNGVENTELERYYLQDGDVIELWYE